MNQDANFLEIYQRGIAARKGMSTGCCLYVKTISFPSLLTELILPLYAAALTAFPHDIQGHVVEFLHPPRHFTLAMEDVCNALLNSENGQSLRMVELLGTPPPMTEHMHRLAWLMIQVLYNDQGATGLRLAQLSNEVGYRNPHSYNFSNTTKALEAGGILVRNSDLCMLGENQELLGAVISAAPNLCDAEITVLDRNGMLMFHDDVISIIGRAD